MIEEAAVGAYVVEGESCHGRLEYSFRERFEAWKDVAVGVHW